MRKKVFKTSNGSIPLPVFFPDATRAVLKNLDSRDIEESKTPGILVNTYHLYFDVGKEMLRKHGGVKKMMSWSGAMISDSGGFQLMSLIKARGLGKVKDEGIEVRMAKNKKVMFRPEDSIGFQMEIGADMVVVLDDFTPPQASYEEAKETVGRTIEWAKRSKNDFEKRCKQKKLGKNERPYLLGVVQGGFYEDLRRFCAQELVKIGFDGFGFGGWPIKNDGKFDEESAKIIAEEAPDDYLLYGLGIGKPEDIVKCVNLGYTIFDCVLPTRDARHKRLYVYKAKSIEEIKLDDKGDFYDFWTPKEKDMGEVSPISEACDCLTCQRYSRGYLAHLFKTGDMSAGRLATIHNLRFYSILMEKLRKD